MTPLLDTRRASVRPLLDERAIADALASYYTFHHPPDRVELVLHYTDSQRADGFLVRARTGLDLFRPLVTFRAPTEAVAVELFQNGLQPNRPAYLTIPESLAGWANKHLTITEAELLRIYRFNPEAQAPMINVLAVMSKGPDGTPRCEIRSGGQVSATAGVNWQSPQFAEVYVYTEPAVRGRGWGRTVVSMVAREVLKSGRRPIYVVAESNDVSIRLAEAVGFEDTGLREYAGQAVKASET